MTKEDIVRTLNDPKKGQDNRKVLAFCKEPKTIQQMQALGGVKREVFDVLIDLKKVDALAFANGKYVATELALEVLKSLS